MPDDYSVVERKIAGALAKRIMPQIAQSERDKLVAAVKAAQLANDKVRDITHDIVDRLPQVYRA